MAELDGSVAEYIGPRLKGVSVALDAVDVVLGAVELLLDLLLLLRMLLGLDGLSRVNDAIGRLKHFLQINRLIHEAMVLLLEDVELGIPILLMFDLIDLVDLILVD